MGTKKFELFWENLTKETQEELYKFLGNENGNYDVFPLAVIEIEEDN